MTRAEAMQFRSKLDRLIDVLDDEDALDNTVLFPEWAVDTDYVAGDRRQFGGELYKCVQAHRSQADWTPDVTPALWVKISIEEWPEWVQPTGAHDAYALDAKTSHNGKHWISEMDGNTWEPGVFGWREAE